MVVSIDKSDVGCADRGKIFWATAAEGGERVETARGDGSERRVLLDARREPRLAGVASTAALYPALLRHRLVITERLFAGMRVDAESDRLYWVNQASATIQYIDLQTEKVFTVSMIHWFER